VIPAPPNYWAVYAHPDDGHESRRPVAAIEAPDVLVVDDNGRTVPAFRHTSAGAFVRVEYQPDPAHEPTTVIPAEPGWATDYNGTAARVLAWVVGPDGPEAVVMQAESLRAGRHGRAPVDLVPLHGNRARVYPADAPPPLPGAVATPKRFWQR
jgi:hypothetical protein